MRDTLSPPLEPTLDALAAFVADTPERAIPRDARDHAPWVLADTVGAILGGATEPETRRLAEQAARAPGPATVLGPGFPRLEPWWAIVANGTSGTMLEQDEGNRFARGHPAIHVFPAALAEAERAEASGETLLAAFILGYDVAARLGGAAPVAPGFHMHGIHGVVGAAAAVARIRGLDRKATARALAVAAGLTLATSWRTALGGATVRNLYAGVGGANGWLAVDLAEAGFTGLPDMLTETFSRASGRGLDQAFALDELGRRFEVTRNYFKLYACCRFNHAALEALEAVLETGPISPGEIGTIRVATYGAAATMSDRDPVGVLGAKFSIPYALAARLVLGHAGPDAFREPALSDPRIRALASRVEVVEDPALTALWPERRPARVDVVFHDHRRASRQVDVASGEFDRPYPRALLAAKFAGLTEPILDSEGAGRAFALCLGVERLRDARALTGGLRALAAVVR